MNFHPALISLSLRHTHITLSLFPCLFLSLTYRYITVTLLHTHYISISFYIYMLFVSISICFSVFLSLSYSISLTSTFFLLNLMSFLLFCQFSLIPLSVCLIHSQLVHRLEVIYKWRHRLKAFSGAQCFCDASTKA